MRSIAYQFAIVYAQSSNMQKPWKQWFGVKMAITHKIMETFLNLRGFYYPYCTNNRQIKYNLSIHGNLCAIVKYVKTLKPWFCTTMAITQNKGKLSKNSSRAIVKYVKNMETIVLYDDSYYSQNNGNPSKFERFPLFCDLVLFFCQSFYWGTELGVWL